VASSLLKAKDVGSRVASEQLSVSALKDYGIPSCSDSIIALSGKPQVAVHQYGTTGNRYHGEDYGQLLAVYSDAAAASNEFAIVKTKSAQCPAKRHIASKRLPGNVFTVEHDDTWTVTSDTISSWSHLRGFEKHVEPPSSSIYNVFYISYDYAVRGNVFLATVYFQRVKPSASGAPIAQKATKLLTKQLTQIG
jgi:hypothetical protein